MVFPSVSVFLDPPSWHQAPNNQQAGGGGGDESTQLPLPVLPLHHHVGGGGGGAGGIGTIRPGSMADRARMARLPQPEAGLKCPRCSSTNTKFCYFNNYSLTQPRHFCKTCRRYWTRGGALRNVPVGGGCRRNKRSSCKRRGNSKSPASSNSQHLGANVGNNCSANAGGGAVSDMMIIGQNHLPQMDLVASLPNLGQFGIDTIGLNIAGMNQAAAPGPAMAGVLGSGGGGGGGGGLEPWRMGQMQQYPFLGGFDQPNNMYPFQGGGGDDEEHGIEAQARASMVGEDHLGSKIMGDGRVKMEESRAGIDSSFSSQLFGINAAENGECWGGLGSSSAGGHFFSKTSA